ncbi:MAG: septum formation initiator family protein [Desulfobulbaceae bacterium]|nr:septum formation initiator family protein [Desulfobulbaceae bacterium]
MPARKIDLKTRKLLRAGWLVALLLLAMGLFSPWGAIRYYQLSNELAQLETTNLDLRENNRKLGEEVDRLTKDPAYIEKIVREQHGLLKTNEFVYVFPNKKKAKIN